MEFIDTHCHLNDPKFSHDWRQVVDRAAAAGVGAFVVVGYDLDSSRTAIKLAHEHEAVYAAVGIHPHDARDADAEALRTVADLAADPRVVAVGESGLDFFRDLSPRDVQRRAFADFIKLAADLDKPLIVHSRDADAEVLEVLADTLAEGQRVIRHCFAGGPETVAAYADLGCYIGIAATVTYPKAEDVRAAAAAAPAHLIVLETDCPWLPPQQSRGKRNEPALIPSTADAVAQARGETISQIAARTTANARDLYRLRG
ncbi:MAG TPA: hydrolase TatD [Armatimonadetes bacterium]|jgi:TatD DNase family protein|nr:hydrolase TatD [Armatimonadota bacterium]